MAKMRIIVAIALIFIVALTSTCYRPGGAESDPAANQPEAEQEIIDNQAPPQAQEAPLQAENLGNTGDGVADATPGDAPEEPEGPEEPEETEEPEELEELEEPEEPEPQSTIRKVTISAAGDTTLGGDPRYSNQFIREFERRGQDHGFFMRGVKHIFQADEISIVNFEGTLTDATAHSSTQPYVFRGPAHFAKILSSSGINVASLANNHSRDFFVAGYQDTRDALEAEGVSTIGDDHTLILEVNDIRVGMFGFNFWGDSRAIRDKITAAIEELRAGGAQLIIAYYHWGGELDTRPRPYQRAVGRFTIDSGADLVLGAHAHVLQGIEVYKGKNIVYSLGNFSFGGNNNPRDHDTMIFRQTFTFDDGVLQDTNDNQVIPARISSERGRNNFQPIVAQGAVAERILEKIQTYSDELNA